MIINIRIKELRTERGLTQLEVAKGINYSKAIIGFWENGLKDPSASAVYALAKFFNVSADYLLGLKDE